MSLKIGLLGAGKRGVRRLEALKTLERGVAGFVDEDPKVRTQVVNQFRLVEKASAGELFAECEIVFIAAPTESRFSLAKEAIGKGTNVFLEWPVSANIEESMQLAKLADEAGVEIGVSRPLPISAILVSSPINWQPRIVSVSLSGGPFSKDEPSPVSSLIWTSRLAGVIDLCFALAGSRSIQTVDAEADREAGGLLRTVAFSLRFRNGCLAQCHVRQRDRASDPEDRFELAASGSSMSLSARSFDGPVCVERTDRSPRFEVGAEDGGEVTPHLRNETDSFLRAIGEGRRVPFSIHDALHVAQSVERLMERLR